MSLYHATIITQPQYFYATHLVGSRLCLFTLTPMKLRASHITHRYNRVCILTLKVLVATIDAQWEGMGDVGSARYELALLPPCPTIRVLSYSN